MSTVYKINAAADEFTLAVEQFHKVSNALRSSELLNLEHGEVAGTVRRTGQGIDVRGRHQRAVHAHGRATDRGRIDHVRGIDFQGLFREG